MSIAVSRIDLSNFELLPKHDRRCVFWEVDPGPKASAVDGSPESEFDKEAWVSATLLEWGACGQMAIDSSTGKIVGTAFYAPPGMVPRSRYFPTAPVSADAVQLTGIRTEPGHETAAVLLLDAVLADLVRRGARAVEAFGIVRSHIGSGEEAADSDRAETSTGRGGHESGYFAGISRGGDIENWSGESIVEVAREILDSPMPDLCTRCLIDADFLLEGAFEVVKPHSRFPRLRLELDEGLGWKSEVEGALEKLFMVAQLDLESTGRSSAPVAERSTGAHKRQFNP